MVLSIGYAKKNTVPTALSWERKTTGLAAAFFVGLHSFQAGNEGDWV